MLSHHATAASAAFTVALALIVSCSDSGPTDPSVFDPNAVNALGAGGGWTPSVETAARRAGKIAICHSGNGKNFVAINVSVNAIRAHLGDPMNGSGGHVADYRISELTPCPPPAQLQRVQVCKVAGNGIVAGANYDFRVTVNGVPQNDITVPTGSCMDVGSFRVGTRVIVEEVPQQNVMVTALTISPPGAQTGITDMSSRRAMVVVGLGTTTFTYTNTSTTHGSVVVCKVAGSGVATGTSFSFTVAGVNVNVPAGAGPMGSCSEPIVSLPGNVTATEAAVPGVVLTAVSARNDGTDMLVSSDLANRTATAMVHASERTSIFFTNSVAGTLVICKIAGTGVAAGTNFQFAVDGQTVTVAAGAPPNGTCSTPVTLPIGSRAVTEAAVTGTSVQAITGTPAPTDVNLAGRSATTQISSGQESRITFTNRAP